MPIHPYGGQPSGKTASLNLTDLAKSCSPPGPRHARADIIMPHMPDVLRSGASRDLRLHDINSSLSLQQAKLGPQ